MLNYVNDKLVFPGVAIFTNGVLMLEPLKLIKVK